MADAQYLEEIIKASGLKKQYLADKCNMTRQSFSTKCKNPSLFTAGHVSILCKELNITSAIMRNKIFFP